jgi:ferrous iron transport protein B
MGFGCSVPAILSTRTLENEKDKRLTIMLIPFMSCPAKTPIYLVFISAFFPHNKALIMFSLYLMGIVVAILLALLFQNTILKGSRGAFVMELPPYRMPTIKNLWIHVSERAKDFLTRAGTILLAASIIIWFLRTFDFSFHMVANGQGSILESIGKFISPIFTPCGFDSWEAAVALISGLVAKESVVSTLGVLTNNLASIFPSALSAFAFLTFTLLYTPCIAALSATYKEMHSKRWFAFAVIMQLVVAYIISLLVFQIGNLIF